MKKYVALIVAVVVIIGGVYLYQQRASQSTVRNPSDRPSEDQIALPIVTADYVKYQGRVGQDAFTLLRAATTVEFKKYDFGVFVESINGIKPDSKHFWKFYLNGKESQVGADQVQTQSGDIIEWKLEEITN